MTPDDFIDEQGNWVCIKCGACCKLIPCPYLNPLTNLCSIYELRPNTCREENASDEDKARACSWAANAVGETV